MIIRPGAFIVIAACSIAAARWSHHGGAARDRSRNARLAQCAVKLLDASKNRSAAVAAVFVSNGPEVVDDLRSELLVAAHRRGHAALLLRGRFDATPFNPHRHTKPYAYLVAARRVSDLADHLDAVNVTDAAWRPRADFVVVLQRPVAAAAALEPVVRRLWANFMLRSVLLAPASSSSAVVDVYAWYPFRDGGCGRTGEPAVIGACGDDDDAGGGGWDASGAFDGRVPDVFPGCAVTVAGFHWPPMTVLTDGAPRAMSHGMDVETVRLMGRAGNLTLAFREVPGGQRWGVKSADGTWDGGFGELAAHRADVLIGGGIMTAERLEMFDCAATRQVIQFPIFTPLPRRLPYWRNMLHVFSAGSWLTLFAAFLLTAGLIWASGARLPSERPAFADCGHCLVVTWAVLCSVAAGRQPTSAASKMIFLSWTVYVLHISAVYTSMQLIYLYRPKYEGPVMRTVADVERSGLTVCAVPTFIPIAHAMDPENFNLTEYTPCANMTASTVRLLRNKDIAILDPEDHFEALAPPGSAKKINKVEEMVIVYNIGVYLQKGSPYAAVLARAQSYAYETGLHSKWRKDAVPPKLPVVSHERNVKVKKLNTDELQGAFIILACGLCVSSVVFYVERLSTIKLSSKRF